MSTASLSSAAPRVWSKLSLRRLAAWVYARAVDPQGGIWFVIGVAAAHAALWTLILINLKAAQDVHMDVAEAYAWGQKVLLGYGKHPPLSGWVTALWFKLFPVRDWSTYALAMTVLAAGMVISWFTALRVVDRRRAFFVVVMLALYPIFNFKGFKYNPDLLQLVTLPLVVLAYLNAFEKRDWRSGVWLGLAGALALLTKYWVATMIGAVGLAALIHPERVRFLTSPAPWVAIVTLVVAMFPHLVWLKQVDFVPFTYAGDIYQQITRATTIDLTIGYAAHNFALLALPVLLALLALSLGRRWWSPAFVAARTWSRGPNPGVNISQALNVWIIQAIVAIGPPIGAIIFVVYLKTDWGISLFFLVPLALVALPVLRIQRLALFNITAIWLVVTLATLIASPWIAVQEMIHNSAGPAPYVARSELARELTQAWHSRFNSRWAVVVGQMDVAEPMVFYSPDHPAPFTPDEAWSSGLTTLEEAKRLGFIGICDTATTWNLPACEEWMAKNAAKAERLVMTTQRFYRGHPGPSRNWKVYIVPPAK
jgi:4-amino-4-deoxy-L-arabinose transferase-like glycosyltransferase